MIQTTKLAGYDLLKSFQLGGAINVTEDEKEKLFPYFAYLYSQQLNPEKYGTVNSLEEWTSIIQDSPEDVEQITKAAAQLSDEDWNNLSKQYAEMQQEDKVNISKDPQYVAKGAKLKRLKSRKTSLAKEVTKAISNPVITKKDGGPTELSGPTIYGKKPATKKIVLTNRVPNTYKGMDIGVKPANSHTEKVTVVKKITSKSKGGEVVLKKTDKVKLIKKGSAKKCTCGCNLIKSKAEGGKVIETCSCKCGGKMKKK